MKEEYEFYRFTWLPRIQFDGTHLIWTWSEMVAYKEYKIPDG